MRHSKLHLIKVIQRRFAVSRRAASCSFRDCVGLTEESVATHLVDEFAAQRMDLGD